MEITEDQVEMIMKKQAFETAKEVANHCVMICEANKGCLFVGDIIKKQFALKDIVLTDNTIVPKKDTKKSHLTLVKK